MQDKITIADAPDCLNTNDKAMWVLGYQAALAAHSTCLHQIQVPAAAEQAAWHAGLDEGLAQASPTAVAVADELAALEDATWYWVEKEGWVGDPPTIAPALYKAECDAWYSFAFSGIPTRELKVLEPCLMKARAALAATPAHHAPDAKRLIDEAKAHASKASRLTRVLLNEPTGTLADTDIAIWIEHAQQLLNTLAATPAAAPVVPKWIDDPHDIEQGQMLNPEWVKAQETAAAPVVLPEPVGAIAWNRDGSRSTFHAGCRDKELLRARLDEGLSGGPYRTEFAFTEPQMRALLATATGLPAQAVAYIDSEVLTSFLSSSNYRPEDGWDCHIRHQENKRDTDVPLYSRPQAQADARGAESDYQRGYRHGYNRRDAEVQGALL